MLTLNNKKLHDLIVLKDTLVYDGRKISQEMDKLEVKIKDYEDQEKKITANTKPPKELEEQGNKLAKEIETIAKELEKIAKEIEASKLAAIPEAIKKEHQDLMKQSEALERDRNKVALKVQKIKDKVVPLIQKEVKPLLKEYDDIETAKVKDGKVVIATFNHLEDFKKKFRNK
jgi:seryl-tRNA synthetase